MTKRLMPVLLAVATLFTLLGTAQAASAPVEAYSSYQPQTKCSAYAKAGAKVLRGWVVPKYGGRPGRIASSCAGGSVSEHKEGRAVDWMLNARSTTDRARANRFLQRILATGPSGQRHELARRMGIMYVIWNDRMFASYDQFRPKAYRSSSCRNKPLASCPTTLRHRDHMHISLNRNGGYGKTSFYAGRLPGR